MSIRVGSVNGGGAIRRAVTIDYRLSVADALVQVDRALDLLDGLACKGGDAGCDLLVFTEDALGTGAWESAHPDAVVPRAECADAIHVTREFYRPALRPVIEAALDRIAADAGAGRTQPTPTPTTGAGMS